MMDDFLFRQSYTSAAIFDDYFALGQEDRASPFLKPSSRKWAINLPLKASVLAAFFLAAAFVFSFSPLLVSLANLLLVFVYFFAGIPCLIASIKDLANLDVNIDVLMTLAAFSSVLIGSSIEGALLLVLFALSGSIEDAVTAKAKGSLHHLNKLSPVKAYVIDAQGNIFEKSLKDIHVGALILVKSGEIIPLDGVIREGISSVSLVHLTGESMPLKKQTGDEIPAGAHNMEGALTIEVSHTSSDSTLTRIIQLVTQAQEARPKLQRWFDRFGRSYALTIIFLSAFFALSFPILLGLPFLGFEGSVYRSLAFLIAASPCALIIAIPIAYLSAVSACARKGILLKGGIVLDDLARCGTIAFDKTGTLTEGKLSCTEIQILSPGTKWSREAVIGIAYSLERQAVHPISQAVVEYAQKYGANPSPLSKFRQIPGYGVEAFIPLDHTEIFAFMGHLDYLKERLSPTEQQQLEKHVSQISERGEISSTLMIGSDLFLFAFQDKLRPFIQNTLEALRRQHYKLLMLTGDHDYNAKRVAQELSLDRYYANLRPENKLKYVSDLAQEKEGLIMVGDGINDAPALARATVGICMGKVGSDTSIEASDVVLLHDNLERLDWLMGKAKKTRRIVKQNLTIAIGAITLASLPALAGIVPLWLAVIMHEGGTVLVGINALRLLK